MFHAIVSAATLILTAAWLTVQLGFDASLGAMVGLTLCAAALPLLMANQPKPAARMVGWMTVGAVAGWLCGLQAELGPFGLAILSSWCETTTFNGLQAVIAKFNMLPLSHLGMFAGGLIGMLAAVPWRDGAARGGRCCVLAAFAMPLGYCLSDIAMFELRSLSSALPVSAIMLTAMVGGMLLCGAMVISAERVLFAQR